MNPGCFKVVGAVEPSGGFTVYRHAWMDQAPPAPVRTRVHHPE